MEALKTVSIPRELRHRTAKNGLNRPFSKSAFGIMGGMRTYYCEKCNARKRLDPKTVSARNEEAWCYCNPQTPTRLTELSWKKEQKKYEGIFKSFHPTGEN